MHSSKARKSHLTVLKLDRLGGSCYDGVLKGDFTACDYNCVEFLCRRFYSNALD